MYVLKQFHCANEHKREYYQLFNTILQHHRIHPASQDRTEQFPFETNQRQLEKLLLNFLTHYKQHMYSEGKSLLVCFLTL